MLQEPTTTLKYSILVLNNLLLKVWHFNQNLWMRNIYKFPVYNSLKFVTTICYFKLFQNQTILSSWNLRRTINFLMGHKSSLFIKKNVCTNIHTYTCICAVVIIECTACIKSYPKHGPMQPYMSCISQISILTFYVIDPYVVFTF